MLVVATWRAKKMLCSANDPAAFPEEACPSTLPALVSTFVAISRARHSAKNPLPFETSAFCSCSTALAFAR